MSMFKIGEQVREALMLCDRAEVAIAGLWDAIAELRDRVAVLEKGGEADASRGE